MQLSVIPVLVIVIFGFLIFFIRKLYSLGQLNTAKKNWFQILLVILLVWGGFSGYLSSSGIYVSADFLQLAPGYWLPYIPVIITVTLVLLITPLRNGLREFVDYVPDYWLTGIHVLRILALGALIKATMGLFPEKFAWYVGIPDLLFGLSAIPVTLLVRQQRLKNNILVFWHLTGALVIMIPTIGFMHIFMKERIFSELFTFPMALAPTLVVPMLVMLNLMVVWRLLERKFITKSSYVY
ncbi:MAG: hypothetical protein ACC641_11120 [Acidiferrobacterales bacterium]